MSDNIFLVVDSVSNELDVEKVPATNHITGLQNVTRPDEEWLICSPSILLEAAPEVEKQQVKVKAVFSSED